MNVFYFGTSKRPLYGIYHSPGGTNYRNSAILLCNSIAHEYIRSHRALKQLADRLAEMGYYVLRFDYHGIGDSAGDFCSMQLSYWLEDIQLASEELRAISELEKITVIGLRLGATLSLQASSQANFDQIILWDPVISGQEYVGNLKTLHGQLLVSKKFASGRNDADTAEHEYIGYQYSEHLIAELDNLALAKIAIPVNQLLKVIHTSESEQATLNDCFDVTLSDCSIDYIQDMGNWQDIDSIEKSLTPRYILNHICKVLK